MLAILMVVSLTACGRESVGTPGGELENGVAAIEDAMTTKPNESSSASTTPIDDLRDGSSTDTVATPGDFPDAYNFGSGKISDYSRTAMLQKMPEPAGNNTVLNTAADPANIQVLYLWEEGNVPARTKFTQDMTGYFDDWNFRPYVTAIPVREGVKPKGAVVLMAGGAYQFRGNYTDSLPTAAALRELGFQTFIVDYRLSPYTQEEGALDVARAVRFVRKNAEVYGIDPDDIAVMGFSAGGIQAGEFLMHYDEDVTARRWTAPMCRTSWTPFSPMLRRRHDLFLLWPPQRGEYGCKLVDRGRFAADLLCLRHRGPLLSSVPAAI